MDNEITIYKYDGFSLHPQIKVDVTVHARGPHKHTLTVKFDFEDATTNDPTTLMGVGLEDLIKEITGALAIVNVMREVNEHEQADYDDYADECDCKEGDVHENTA